MTRGKASILGSELDQEARFQAFVLRRVVEAKTGDNADKVLVSLLKDEDCIHTAGELPAGPFDRILHRVARFCEGITAASPICSVNTLLEHCQKLWALVVPTELLGQ